MTIDGEERDRRPGRPRAHPAGQGPQPAPGERPRAHPLLLLRRRREGRRADRLHRPTDDGDVARVLVDPAVLPRGASTRSSPPATRSCNGADDTAVLPRRAGRRGRRRRRRGLPAHRPHRRSRARRRGRRSPQGRRPTSPSGYDNIDVAAARRAGVAVCNTPGVLDETTADLAFLLILAAARLAWEAERDLRAGAGRAGASTSTWAATCTAPPRARRLRPHRRGGGPAGLGDSACRCCTTPGTPPRCPGYVAALDALLAESDIVSLHVPLNDATRHLIGRARAGSDAPDMPWWSTRRGGRWSTRRRSPMPSTPGRIFAAGPRRLRARARGPPPTAERSPHRAAPPHRQCHPGHPDPGWRRWRARASAPCSPDAARRTS